MNRLQSPSLSPAIVRRRHARTGFVVVMLALVAATSGCGFLGREQLDNFSLTYKINIQQGVVVTREMADMLKPGMTRDQVRFVLGTPIITDPFHADRWDYPFRFQPGRGRIELRHFTVYFANDAMARVESDPLPTEEEFAASRNFATTRIARGLPPLKPVAPPVPGSTASSAGGSTSTPTTVNVPVKAPQGSTPDNTDTSVPAPPTDSTTPR